MTDRDDDLELWALDALDARELEQFDRWVADNPSLSSSADGLRRVVAMMGEQHSAAAPMSVRDNLLSAARLNARRSSAPQASSAVEAYAHQVSTFAEVIRQITDEQWLRPAAPYSWTVHGLVAHLLQIERYMARVLGFTTGEADPAERDHLQFGAARIEDELDRSPADTFAAWCEVVDDVLPRLDMVDLDDRIMFHQYPFSVGSMLVARSFELWTHADDIRRAVGIPHARPVGADVRLMSDVSVTSLPLAIHVITDRVPNSQARLVLTGDGGGVWDLQLGQGGPETVSIVADVVDYCRVAARRIKPEDLVVDVVGDVELAMQLLRSAAVVAV
jgi:uncharacterized protein (TIGR03083 family)